jgi:hypothetical protein
VPSRVAVRVAVRAAVRVAVRAAVRVAVREAVRVAVRAAVRVAVRAAVRVAVKGLVRSTNSTIDLGLYLATFHDGFSFSRSLNALPRSGLIGPPCARVSAVAIGLGISSSVPISGMLERMRASFSYSVSAVDMCSSKRLLSDRSIN